MNKQTVNLTCLSSFHQRFWSLAFAFFFGAVLSAQVTDLELGLSINPPDPNIYQTTSLTLTLNNTGGTAATAVMVEFLKPDGTVYQGGNEWTASQGTFTPFGNEMWDVGSIPAGGSATLEVNYFMLTALPVTVYAQVSAANETDADSTPGNGISPAANEDDETVGSINGSTTDPCVGDLTINTQADLNNFPSSCTVWDGNLLILGTDISDLSPLSNLQQVTGDLHIADAPNLLSLNGLQNLTSTGGSLQFTTNENLNSATALSNVQSVGGRLQFTLCNSLQSLDGLQNVTSVGQLWLTSNSVLSECCAVFDLINDGGVSGSITIFLNPQGCNDEAEILANCDGGQPCSISASVSNLQCSDNGTPNSPGDDVFTYDLTVNSTGDCGSGWVSGMASGDYGETLTFGPLFINQGPVTLFIQDAQDPSIITQPNFNPPAPCSNGQNICPGDITLSSQAEVDAWPGCTIVEGNLVISGNDITDLGPLVTLEKVRGLFSLDGNTALSELSGLNNLDSVGVLFITKNASLNNLAGLDGLTQTEIVSLVISENGALPQISNLNNFINADFLSIDKNASLQSVTGLSNLQSMDGLIQIAENPSLTDLSGFSGVTTINSQLVIVDNDALTEINGFGNLSTLTDLIIVSSNDNLLNINGLSNLSNPFGFAIASNPNLQNLDVLGSITSIPGALNVLNNASLSDCCGLYPLLNSGGVGGNLTISGNPMFCASETEIFDNCVPSGDIDLSISLAQPNATPAQWSNYDVVLTIENAGPQTATGVQVSFAKPAGVVYTGGNEFDASQGTFNAFSNEVWTVGSLPAGGSATLTVSYFLLAPESPVAYAQVSAANEQDGDSTPGNGTPPAVNEDDEASTGGDGPPDLNPDLVLADLNIQNSPVEAGQVLNYQFDISNQGDGPASGNFNVRAWISTDQAISPDDVQDGIVPTGNYGAGLTVTDIAGASTVPSGLADGQYFLILKVDADDAISESNEGNNVIASPFTISGGGTGEPSCSFTTFFEPAGIEPLSIDFGRDFDFEETPTGYIISQEFDTYAPVSPAPATFDTYELDLAGNVVSAFGTPIVPAVDVALQTTSDEGLEMVFNLSPDLPAGTIVPIDLDYPNPPADVFASSQALRTSTGYAFGVGIVDPTTSQLIYNRIYQTDHVGQNVTYAELPESAFFFGSNIIFEGPDGSIISDWRASGNFSLFVVPGDGSTPWQVRVATDTPSSSWIETEASLDGNFVYTMKTDNLQTFVAKYNVSTGELLGIDLSDLKIPVAPSSFRYTRAHGIEPTADGGLLVTLRANEVNSSSPDFEVLAKYDATGNLVWKTEIPDPGFQLTPVGETSDGGALFAGDDGVGMNETQSVFLKTAAGGALTPECNGGPGGGDIDLSLEMTTSNPSPSIYSSTEVTVEITNAGPQTATGIVVDFPRPAGTVYTGGNEWTATQGSFNPFGNEQWTVGSLAAGQSASLTVSYFLLTANALTPYAQVESANETDGDSTPGNGTCCTPNEDDEAALALNRFAGGNTLAFGQKEIIGRPVQLMAVNPNPVYHGEIKVVIDSREEGYFDLEAFDLFGRRAFLQKVELQEGRNEILLDVSLLQSGTYHLNMPGQNWRNMPLRFVVAR